MKCKITLVEPHGVRTRDELGRVLGSVRINVPLHSQLIVGGILKRNKTLAENTEIKIYNPKIIEPLREEAYKSQEYGGHLITHYRIGEQLQSDSFYQLAASTDILGITVNFTQLAANALAIAAEAKKINPKIKIVAGGSDAYHRHEYYLSTGYFDVIAPKNSELVADRIMLALLGLNGEKLEAIPAITYRGSGKQVFKNGGNNLLDNKHKMSRVPLPAFELAKDEIEKWNEDDEGPLPPGVKSPLAYVEFARGCHEHCSFCTIAGITYSFMATEQVRAYVEHLVKFGFKSIMDIADNTLTQSLIRPGGKDIGRQLLLEKYRLLKEHGITWNFGNGLQYSLYRCPDGKINTELIDAMFSNAYATYVPIEDPHELQYPKLHGWPSARKNDPRNTATVFEQNTEILEYIVGTGVPQLTLGIIIGYPNETQERLDAFATLLIKLTERLRKINPELRMLYTPFLHEPLPGSADFSKYKQVMKYGVEEHPELWQYGLTTYGKGELNEWRLVEARLKMIEILNGKDALKSWTSTGTYPMTEGKG